ncbi:MAG: GGDEF domain-containing protein [Elusimicrobia bacterium]|nr:GGDEF domain-containing protein [Elusimicrobiota bacterium]
MSAPRRRQRDFRSTTLLARLRAIPHYYLYPAAGSVLGFGSPIGMFLLRYWREDPLLKALWVRNELDYNFLFYAYMGLGTVASFMIFGYVIGLRSERQRVNNRVLSARVDELHLKSVTDALTGAFTHGYLQEILELEIQQSLTRKVPLSVMMIDIDDFKRINDSHGHLFGDRVIKETAETISANVRSDDILGRFGGDEFVVIMPGADAPTARHVAERARSGIAKNGYLATISVGVATFDGAGNESPAELLHRADMNLYQAKHDGKNCVRNECHLPGVPRRRTDKA